MKKITILYLTLTAVLAILFVLSLNAIKIQTRDAQKQTSVEVLGSVPNFKLFDQSGSHFSSADLTGKYWIADFIFTRCAGPCPLMTQQMRTLQTKLSGYENISFISFSVDPEYDTSQVLKAYAGKYQADLNNWSFLTGQKDEIFKLARQHFYLGVGEVPLKKWKKKTSMFGIVQSLF